ncbi:MAG TPA: hypothetical protein VFB03_01610 [Candidatus Saccharimonadales bacterium]|nr:hypothetical protein [Candidatus Saccharimonadales bacterium]
MRATGELAAYTVPSTWTRPEFKPTVRPYNRVVGLTNNGEVLWQPTFGSADPNHQFSKSDAERVAIPSNDIFAKRLIEFFARYIAECRGGHISTETYNCHRFGLWMVGADSGNSVRPPTEVVDSEPIEKGRRLSLGQRGVIGYKFRGHTSASHSIVGLGREKPDCIQVIAVGGHMGIRSYEDTLDHYYDPEYGTNPDFKGFGIYV